MGVEVKEKDYQNDWAKDIKGDAIHIDNASSGLQGYYCLGCDKEMQAVFFKNPKYSSYFRHHASNVDKDKAECVVASKVYRERLAEQILHRLKQLKVPAVYKYPPKNRDGEPKLLQEGKTIIANTVKSQLSFYEDEDGVVTWGKNPEIEERYLLIRPDVTFFNKEGEPILFVEFVITHKLPPEKKIKLHRLGIDTVQIIIPKLPENEIEKSLKSVRKIKWVYNDLEANTNYIYVPKGSTEGISSIDEDQRRFFEESYICRTAQINDLVRKIDKCLRSESYRGTQRDFEQEISRIEDATEKERQGLEDLERLNGAEVFSNFTGEFDQLEREENKFQSGFNDLERRYLSKAREIRDNQDEEDEFIRKLNNRGGLGEKINKLRSEEERLDRKREVVEKQINELKEHIKQEGRRLESFYKGVGEQSITTINNRDIEGTTELSKRIETILGFRRISGSYTERQNTYERNKAYLELARSRAWEKQ